MHDWQNLETVEGSSGGPFASFALIFEVMRVAFVLPSMF